MAKSKRDRALARAKARASAREEKARARLRDTGPDQSGNYSVNPYAARGHLVEVAPKDLGKELPPHSQFPKRIQAKMFDAYKARHHITEKEHKAAVAIWDAWTDAGLEAKVTSGYDPVMVQSSQDMDGRISKKVDGLQRLDALMKEVPYRCRGVVRAVVIEDRCASEWARVRGKGTRDSKGHGMMRLRSGLSALASFLRY